MTYDRTKLAELGARHIAARNEIKEVVPALASEIRLAHEAGMPQVEIVAATGYTRDQIRQICLPPEKRRKRGTAAESS